MNTCSRRVYRVFHRIALSCLSGQARRQYLFISLVAGAVKKFTGNSDDSENDLSPLRFW